jgi:tetratricopeptide (TPR) repeat protein
MVAFALSCKANLLSEMKQFDLAVQCMLECRELGPKLYDDWIELTSLLSLAFIAIHQGEYEKASEYLRLGSALAEKVEEWQWENGKSYLNQVKANLAYRQEDFKQMEQHIHAMTEYQSFYHPEDSLAKAWILRLLGIAVKRQGDWKRAEHYFMQSIAIARAKEDTYGILAGLSGWAESIGLAGRELAAVKIMGAVETQFAAFTKVMNILDQEEFDRSKRLLQEALSPEEFSQAWQEGEKMNLEQTLAYALKELG